jgi:hypothetical protein
VRCSRYNLCALARYHSYLCSIRNDPNVSRAAFHWGRRYVH